MEKNNRVKHSAKTEPIIQVLSDIQNIAYYRVSTQKQGISGLGLEAQKKAVFNFLHKEPDFEFVEVESASGKKKRYELEKAIEKCKEVDGILVIAKLDRLSRNVHFVTGLIEKRVNFVCCDNPNATPFALQILASVAEQEARATSERTKAAIQAKCQREWDKGNYDFKWGSFRYIHEEKKDGDKGYEEWKEMKDRIRVTRLRTNRERRDENRNNIRSFDLIDSLFLRGNGVGEIMNVLNNSKIKPPKGGIWTRIQVSRILNRDKSKAEEMNV